METINNIFKNRCLFRIVMRVLILVSMLGMSSVAYSQAGTTYPVEINAMLTPPYGTCLTDYVGTNRFQCNVLMRDMRATEYYFRIVMTVKDQASGRVVFQTQSDRKMIAPGRPVYMAESGIFGEFFKSQNIKQNYSVYKDGCLKEGAYNFVFQVVDDKDSRHIPISKECVFTARLNEGGAPLLTFPFTGDSIGCDATPINLTWQMPFVTGEQIEYLVEVCPNYNGISGLDCLNNNTKPANFYYSARSFMPMHQLVKTTTMLTPNTTYYWRVSIIDQFGKIKPNSTSKIDSFVYCGTPIEPEPYIPVKEPMVKAIAANLDTVKFDSVLTKDNSTKAYWTLDEVRFNYIAYALDVRKKSQDTWSTYHIEIKQEDPEEKDNYGLSNLKYNEPYEARMQYLKLSDNGDTLYAPYSDTITFTVPNPMDTADCGEILPIKDCNDAKGLVLKQYDTLYANGTPVVLDSVTYKSGDSSVISGFGTVAFPILSNFKLKMQFKEISVNCHGELLKGKVVSVYNESTGAIIDLNHMFGKGDGGGSQSSSEQPEPKKYASKEEAQKNLSTGGFAQVGDSIYTKDPSGNLVPLGKAISMTDEQYTNNNRLDEDNVYCVFHNDTENAEYIGFDADEQNVFRHVASLKDHYESFSKQAGSSDPYIIPYVASNPGRVVKLTATLDGKGWSDAAYNKDSVKFVMPLSGGNYLSLNAKKDGDKFIVDFPGSTPDTHSDVYAIALKGTQYVNVGKIIVESYEWRKQKVKFVPVVNDYTVDTDAISKELNKIYGRFGIEYVVSKDEKFETENINSEFLDDFSIGSGVFTKQSDDMKRLQYYYKEARGIEDSTAYLFLLKDAAESGTLDGDMPQGQICGYIFMHGKTSFADGRLTAHELAHGIYKLDHVFEKAYGIKENSTNNLLDYNNGNQLAHHQWELIKNPGFAWALLESDEENMFLRPDCILTAIGKAFLDKALGLIVTEVVESVAGGNSDEITDEFDSSKLTSNLSVGTSDIISLVNNYFDCAMPGRKGIVFLLKALSGVAGFLDCYNGTVVSYDDGIGIPAISKKSVSQCICETIVNFAFDAIVDKLFDFWKESIAKNALKTKEAKIKACEKIGKKTQDMLNKHLKFLNANEEEIIKRLKAKIDLDNVQTGSAAALSSLTEDFCSYVLNPSIPSYMKETVRAYSTFEEDSQILHVDLFTSLPSDQIDLKVKVCLVDVADQSQNIKIVETIKNYDFVKTKLLNPGLESPVKPGDRITDEDIKKFNTPINLISGTDAVNEYPLFLPNNIVLPDNDGKTVFPNGVSIIGKFEESWWRSIVYAEEGTDTNWARFNLATDLRSYHFIAKLPSCSLLKKNTAMQVYVDATVKGGWKHYDFEMCVSNDYVAPKEDPTPIVETPSAPTPKTYYDECHSDDVKDGFNYRTFSVKSTKNATKEATELRHQAESKYDVPKCSGWSKEQNGNGIYFSPKIMCGENDYRRAENLFYVANLEESEKATVNNSVLGNYLNINNDKLVLSYWENQDANNLNTVDKILEYNTSNGTVEMMNFDDYYTDELLAKIALRLYTKLNVVLFWEFAQVKPRGIKANDLDAIEDIINDILSDNLGSCGFSNLVEKEIKSKSSNILLRNDNGKSFDISTVYKNIGFESMLSVVKLNMDEAAKTNAKILIKSVINGCAQSASTQMKALMATVAKSLCHEAYIDIKTLSHNPNNVSDVGSKIDFVAGDNISLEAIFNWNSVLLSRIDMLMRIHKNSGEVYMGNIHMCSPRFFRDCCMENCVGNASFNPMEYEYYEFNSQLNKNERKSKDYSKMIPEMWLNKFK